MAALGAAAPAAVIPAAWVAEQIETEPLVILIGSKYEDRMAAASLPAAYPFLGCPRL